MARAPQPQPGEGPTIEALPAPVIAAGPRWLFPVLLLVALLVAALLRLPSVTAGYPYSSYVDEGHVLHPVRMLLATGVWEASENMYPALPIRAIAGAARLAVTVTSAPTAARLREEVARPGGRYDVIQPPELIVVARVLSLLLSLGLVLVVAFYARRLAGDAAGAVAAVAAALLPALVIRGAIVIVDVYAAFFVLAAMAWCAGVRHPAQWLRLAAAGACCGLAAVSKYPAGLGGLAVALSLSLAPWRVSERLRGIAIAAAAGCFAAVVAMPSIVLQPAAIWERFRFQGRMYGSLRVGSYWEQAVRKAEWDLPFPGPEIGFTFLALASLGLAVALAERRWRREAVGWAVFAALLIGIHARYSFQAFRNFLPVAALGCVTLGLLAAWVGERLRRPVLAAGVAAALLAILFGGGDLRHALERAALVDSRRQAIDWIAAHGRRGAAVLALAEVPWAPTDLARLRGPVHVLSWTKARPVLRRARPRFVLAAELTRNDGTPLVPEADRGWLLERYDVRATFGSATGSVRRFYFIGNALRVFVLERKPGARGRRPETGGAPPGAAPDRARNAAIISATGANSASGKFSAFSQNSPRPPAPHRS